LTGFALNWKAPADDRVWLGRANLAIRTGRNGEAAGWIDACRRLRPTDPAVVRAWLEWGREIGVSLSCRLCGTRYDENAPEL
jgi:hypothetical protein